MRRWWTVVGVPRPRRFSDRRGAEWRVDEVRPRDLPDGVPLWAAEEDALLAGGYLHDHRAVARGLPERLRHTHVSRRGRALKVS